MKEIGPYCCQSFSMKFMKLQQWKPFDGQTLFHELLSLYAPHLYHSYVNWKISVLVWLAKFEGWIFFFLMLQGSYGSKSKVMSRAVPIWSPDLVYLLKMFNSFIASLMLLWNWSWWQQFTQDCKSLVFIMHKLVFVSINVSTGEWYLNILRV